MEKWIKYSLYLVILYTIWTLIFEYIIKKHTNCFCVTLLTYVFAGTIALILLFNHIKKDCKHMDKLTDINNIPLIVLALIILVSFCIISTNKLWLKALENGKNSGYVGSISNLYIVFVTILSSYIFAHKINNKGIMGIIMMLGGAYLIAK